MKSHEVRPYATMLQVRKEVRGEQKFESHWSGRSLMYSNISGTFRGLQALFLRLSSMFIIFKYIHMWYKNHWYHFSSTRIIFRFKIRITESHMDSSWCHSIDDTAVFKNSFWLFLKKLWLMGMNFKNLIGLLQWAPVHLLEYFYSLTHAENTVHSKVYKKRTWNWRNWTKIH